jgi:hypothetical protein
MPLSSLQPPISEAQTVPPMNPPLPQTAVAALRQGHMIEAVKLVRLEQNIGLREAKEQVDAYLRDQPVLRSRIEHTQADAREGLFRWLMFLFIGGAGLAYFLT